ncbi:MAG: GNAT family N-acetyltransferase [candidate division KSB1 bacterium]|nr:GNAT family N-acetyltransferase [candidate division KSB1 bacterium]
MNTSPATFRRTVLPQDRESVREIVTSAGFFYPAEIPIAVELVNERLEKGEASGYHFIFAEIDGKTVGYACYGPIPCTMASWDLYWIAVHQKVRGQGIGKALLRECEAAVRNAGGRRLYIETSGRELYAPTRAFYLANGCILEATLKDFYAPGDDKCIFVKVL